MSQPRTKTRAAGLSIAVNILLIRSKVAVGVLGGSISTDAKFFDVDTKQPMVSFSQFGKETGEVLFHINLFAAEVNEKVFNRKTYTYRKETTTDEEAKRRQHPDAVVGPFACRVALNLGGLCFSVFLSLCRKCRWHHPSTLKISTSVAGNLCGC